MTYITLPALLLIILNISILIYRLIKHKYYNNDALFINVYFLIINLILFYQLLYNLILVNFIARDITPFFLIIVIYLLVIDDVHNTLKKIFEVNNILLIIGLLFFFIIYTQLYNAYSFKLFELIFRIILLWITFIKATDFYLKQKIAILKFVFLIAIMFISSLLELIRLLFYPFSNILILTKNILNIFTLYTFSIYIFVKLTKKYFKGKK